MSIEDRLRKVEQRMAILEAALGSLLQDMGQDDDEEPPQLEDMDGNTYPAPAGGRSLS